MPHSVRLYPITDAGMLYVAQHLREVDLREIAAGSRRTPFEAIWHSAASSAEGFEARAADGRVICVGGVGVISAERREGSPWMLATDELQRHPMSLMRLSSDWIADVRKRYASLFNFVHAENHVSIAWLRRLGFTVLPAVPHGPFGALFHPFKMEGEARV